MSQTLYDKIWNEHIVHQQNDGTTLLYVDRHLIHEVTSPQAYTQNSIMYTVYFNNLITLEKNTTFAMRWQGTGTDISMNFSLLLDVDIPIG